MSKWVIKDWAGNVLWSDARFSSFEEGWNHIYVNNPMPSSNHPDYVHWYDDYYVEATDD